MALDSLTLRLTKRMMNCNGPKTSSRSRNDRPDLAGANFCSRPGPACRIQELECAAHGGQSTRLAGHMDQRNNYTVGASGGPCRKAVFYSERSGGIRKAG